MSAPRYPRVASFRSAAAFRQHLARHRIPLDFDDELSEPCESPLAQRFEIDGVAVGNRFCILPMEGWDGTREGQPSDLTLRRWRRFGQSGAKLIWGGEAVAVRHDGRANPHQLLITERNQPSIAALRDTLLAAHRERFGSNADGDLFVGLQLTHSGRYARPDAHDRPQPLAATPNPVLDARFPRGVRVIDDTELDALVDDFVSAARLACRAGFAFVDIKQCHGYLGHELLGARSRTGRYGGVLENRTRFLTRVIDGIHACVPGLRIGVRLSAFDTAPYRKGPSGVGEREPAASATAAGFGVVGNGDLDTSGVLDQTSGVLDQALAESLAVIQLLELRGVRWISVTAGSPYYNPHVQRPALFPPLDGYLPPEDPLRGVARQIQATARLKAAFPGLAFIGAAYSYLQEWLPHVAQHSVRAGMTDFVGLGRLVLAYPDLPADLLCGRPLRREAFCRTFSDCTTGPRLGMVSGCYPLDPYYAAREDAARVRSVRMKVST